MIVKKKRRVGKKSVKFQVKIIKNNMDNKISSQAKKKKKKLIKETEKKSIFKIKILVTVGESLEGRIN